MKPRSELCRIFKQVTQGPAHHGRLPAVRQSIAHTAHRFSRGCNQKIGAGVSKAVDTIIRGYCCYSFSWMILRGAGRYRTKIRHLPLYVLRAKGTAVGVDLFHSHRHLSDDYCDCIPFVCTVFVDVSVCWYVNCPVYLDVK